MTDRIAHLIRHGEVDNPTDVVYSDLPGFNLSAQGRTQAAAAAQHLSNRTIGRLVASPIDRASQTAAYLVGEPGEIEYDERLTEWRLSERWASTPWPEIETVFPGEMTAYREHPQRLDFAPESIGAVANRVAAVLDEATREITTTEVILVSHQDPIQACRLAVTGRPLSALHESKPGHGSVVTLRRRESDQLWHEIEYWEPDQGTRWPPLGGDDTAP